MKNNTLLKTVYQIVSKFWKMLSVYIFVPLYVNILGAASYGLVSFYSTLQATLNLFGMGLTNTLRREFAAGEDTPENAQRKYMLLRSVENLFIVIGLFIIALCGFGAGFISKKWLNIESLNPSLVSIVITLMGVSIALHFLTQLYHGCLIGLGHQIIANNFSMIFTLIKSGGVVLVIWLISPNLILFYSWHIISDAIYIFMMRIWVIKKLNLPAKSIWHIRDLSNLKSIWRYTIGILLITVILIVNRQADKIIISKFLTLTQLGAYNTATTLGNLTAVLPEAVCVTVFPMFTKAITTGKKEAVGKTFLKTNRIVNLILSCLGAFVAIFALPLMKIWLGDSSYASVLGSAITFIVLSIAILAYQQLPHNLALADGNTKTNVIVGGIFIPIVIASSFFAVKYFGLIGAGVSLLVTSILQTTVYLILIYKRYINGYVCRALLGDTLVPLVISLVLAIISKYFIDMLAIGAILQVVLAVCCGAISLLVLLLVFERKEIKTIIPKVKSFLTKKGIKS